MRRLLVIAALLLAASCGRHSSYVYLYDCSGTITKFDLETKRQIAVWQPGNIAGLSDVVALPVRDGCVLNNVRYVADGGWLVAVAPLDPVTTAEETQRYILLLFEVSDMRLAAHTELPRSATIPNLFLSDSRQIIVGYEIPRDNQPNETWVARYAAATLEPAGNPEKGAPLPAVVPEQSLPPEIPLPDRFTYPVFADR